jgi:hypothetical protein
MKVTSTLFKYLLRQRSKALPTQLAACLLVIAAVLFTMPTNALSIDYRLDNFIVLVDDQIVIPGGFDVISGQGGTRADGTGRRSDIGSRNSIVLGGPISVRIPVEAPALPTVPPPLDVNGAGVAIIGPNVELKNQSRVSHVIYDAATGSFVVSGTLGMLGPALLENDLGLNSLNDTGNKDLPDFPSFPTITPGAVDIVVPANGSASPLPGAYQDLIVGSRGVVNFQSGVYTFRRIIVNTASAYKLNMENDVQINVKEFVRLAEYGDVNPGLSKNVTLYVEGIDNSYGGANKNKNGVKHGAILPAPAAFEYDGDGVFRLCFVFVKNGTMNVRGHSSPPFATQWFGNSFQEIANLRVVLQHPGEICFESTIQCACITNFKLKGDGSIQVFGNNFSSKSVARLAIFTEAAIESLNGLSEGNVVPSADQLFSSLDLIGPQQFNTAAGVTGLLKSGEKYILGIIYPVNTITGNTGGYCIFTDKLLEVP